LAYAVSQCRENSDGFFLHQALVVREGEREPTTVMEIPDIGPGPQVGLCRAASSQRFGGGFPAFGPFQHIAVSPDGSVVIFDVSDEFSVLGHNFLTPEQRGLFSVHADGTGLRRLGLPSHHASFFPFGVPENTFDVVFSPDGRTLAFPDLGPGPDGEEAPQIVAVDLATGRRRQLTQLPPVSPAVDVSGVAPGGLCCPFFLNNETIAFATFANPNGLNPKGEVIFPIVNADGSDGLRLPPSVVALPGSQIDPRFAITSGQPTSVQLLVPGQPVNPTGAEFIVEIFFFDGEHNISQLTNFHRNDTHTFGGEAQHRVFIVASANPLGTNPSENCQIFSVAALGGNLRQLTQFQETDHSRSGCNSGSRGSGCMIFPFGRDVNSGTLVFVSSCDPFGTNPNGEQIFALGADGAGLRQVTQLRGLVTETDGTVTGELAYPFAYPGPASQ
jgi:hypothetical protein